MVVSARLGLLWWELGWWQWPGLTPWLRGCCWTSQRSQCAAQDPVRPQNAAQGLSLGWRVLPGGGGFQVLLQPQLPPAAGWQLCLCPSPAHCKPTQPLQAGLWCQGPHGPTPPAPELKERVENLSMGLSKPNPPIATPIGLALGGQHQLKSLCQGLTQFMGRVSEVTPAPCWHQWHRMMKGHRFQHEFSKGNQLKMKESAKLLKSLVKNHRAMSF